MEIRVGVRNLLTDMFTFFLYRIPLSTIDLKFLCDCHLHLACIYGVWRKMGFIFYTFSMKRST